MRIKTLRPFQDEAVASGVDLFSAAKKMLDVADTGSDAGSRARVINHNGYLLIEAPTGSGKTLMAGSIIERFSGAENVVWFWFAPFKGVVSQTEAFLREQFPGLRLLDLATDRTAEGVRSGGTFVTTWQTVATRVRDKRNVRKESELSPSIDTMVESLRTQGLRIGVVVDEAHHGFGKDTQAAAFFREVLRPEYTILITATPDDADVAAFEKAMGIAELQRIRVSRADAVSAGLIKTGVKCAAYCVSDPAKAALVDLQTTALRDGVAAHRKLKAQLERLQLPLVPLLLVQADSKEKSIEKIKNRLLGYGFTEGQIAVHTAAEPDDDLLSIANDDRIEVLVFKMAVALGFDAPRAFTLVSMRAARDTDFGVQLIGRILRVHRLLQGRALARNLPVELNYGYVFLSDLEAQDGLDKAGQRINQIQTEYAKVSPSTVVMRMGDSLDTVVTVTPQGQTEFGLVGDPCVTIPPMPTAHATQTPPPSQTGFDFGTFFATPPQEGPAGTTRPVSADTDGKYRYPLRDTAPRRFKTQEINRDNDVDAEDCARRFTVSVEELLDAIINKVKVEKRTLEIFSREMQNEFNFAADLSSPRAALLAQEVLLKRTTFDPRTLRQALRKKLADVMREKLMEEADDPKKVLDFLNIILATHPQRLWDAQKAALAQSVTVYDTEEGLPEALSSDTPLATSARNIYGVYPEGLNAWERQFAEMLDSAPNDTVLWWHRNEPHEEWAVNVLMPDGRGFFPDFIIGVKGRKTEQNVLLADPKLNYAREDEAQKIVAEHKTYGRVMILTQHADRWMVATWDAVRKKAIAETEFRFTDMAGF